MKTVMIVKGKECGISGEYLGLEVLFDKKTSLNRSEHTSGNSLGKSVRVTHYRPF